MLGVERLRNEFAIVDGHPDDEDVSYSHVIGKNDELASPTKRGDCTMNTTLDGAFATGDNNISLAQLDNKLLYSCE